MSYPVGRVSPVDKPSVLSSFELVEMSTSLPEVILKEGLHWTNITFKGRSFVWVNHPENPAMIKAHHDEHEALVVTRPECTRPAGPQTHRRG